MSPRFRPITVVPFAVTAVALAFWGIAICGDEGQFNTPVHATCLAAAVAATTGSFVCWGLYARYRKEGNRGPQVPDWKQECMATVRTLASEVAPRDPRKTLPLQRAPWQADSR